MEQKIRAIMKATSWTQQHVAERFQVSQSTVNRWLRGSEPEGHRRDAINATYDQFVGDSHMSDANKIRDAQDIRKLLMQIDRLTSDNISVLLSVIQGFQQANALQPLQALPDDRSEPATPRRG